MKAALWTLAVASIAAHAAPPDLAPLRAALADGRAERLVDHVQLPFQFDGRAEARDGFVARVAPQLFVPAVRRCLQQARPRADEDRFALDCPPYTFYLARDAGGRWRIAEFGVDGEAR